MSSTNVNLGQYDMVLALSQSKINFEIEMLYDQHVINRNWQFLTSLDGETHINSSDNSFVAVKKGWLDKNEYEKKKQQLEAELERIRTKLEDDDTPKEEKPELRRQKDQKKAEIKAVDDQEKSTAKYEVLMDATIDIPRIELINGSHTELMFYLPIKSGNLGYLKSQKIANVDLAGMCYAFKVSIGKIKIDDIDGMYVINDAKKTELRKGGLTNDDFTIESILLNFQNTNVSQYDKEKSKLPEDATQLTNLQVSVTNYFKNIANNTNPYVLGYAIQKNKLAERDKAMLYPTGASYSTSASQVERATGFNFLLLTENHQFPSGPTAGRIDKSLIENVKDKTVTTNGVIGINYGTFIDVYLNQLHASVIDNFDKAFKKSFPDFYGSHKAEGDDEVFSFSKPGLRMNFNLERGLLKDESDNYIHLSYQITVSGNVHKEVPTKIIFDKINTGTVGVDQKFSTEGKYELEGKKGAAGSLSIKLGASKQGKLEVVPNYQPPSIGRDTEKPDCKSIFEAVWLKVARFINPFGLVGGLVSIFVTDDPHKNIVKFDGDVFKPFDFDALKDFSNKVVLPGSNVYTFKNVRLLNGDLNSNDAVLFDIAYAVASN
ncbi:hypothetical protein CLV59_107367 [Chitinophaga dinghuensis]|uniref:Uncharacterized protein n=1 Tax=Chitinophaga dinghuensis TaxID=1539050 RepID=A0A327VU67_9BACT|nr:hypothetical protein [Chitinophaga dinghuensis]RAJ77600.1 hypothetical protein CLV59_107367 [Chitinophaga dinghuensis]